jgi:hypothetical protein
VTVNLPVGTSAGSLAAERDALGGPRNCKPKLVSRASLAGPVLQGQSCRASLGPVLGQNQCWAGQGLGPASPGSSSGL